ncbi:MAG: hypothetical protein VYE73_07895 [Acidobacteriota bacterium]|nr:hypothetical protein [Acidobacteriota bacterium]
MSPLLAGVRWTEIRPPMVRGGMEGLVAVPEAGPAVVVLGIGLLFYVGGLFALLRRPARDPISMVE